MCLGMYSRPFLSKLHLFHDAKNEAPEFFFAFLIEHPNPQTGYLMFQLSMRLFPNIPLAWTYKRDYFVEDSILCYA
jgi:hypothetical protein